MYVEVKGRQTDYTILNCNRNEMVLTLPISNIFLQIFNNCLNASWSTITMLRRAHARPFIQVVGFRFQGPQTRSQHYQSNKLLQSSAEAFRTSFSGYLSESYTAIQLSWVHLENQVVKLKSERASI